MGTNYYARKNCCPTCNKPQEWWHIGKSSYGWRFSFHGDRYSISNIEDLPVVCINDWKKILDRTDVRIFDENEEEISKDDFWELVESKRRDKSHCQAMKEGKYLRYYDPNKDWEDESGNSFSQGEFS